MGFNPDDIRKDFPILNTRFNDQQLIYLDNAATTQKPLCVIDAISNFYKTTNSNVHRGTHNLSIKATEALEESRKKIQNFINAQSNNEVILTKGTTESINLLASSFGERFLNKGDEVIISAIEHHSNIVPWQMVCEKKNAKLRVIDVDDSGNLRLNEYENLISDKTKIVAVSHISNALGTINPIKEIIDKAHSFNIPVMIDGAQAVPHMKIDVQEYDADFYCFSGHKAFGPTGMGVLYGKRSLLDELPPYHGGGEMVDKVTFEKTTYNELPYKFEGGTPNIAGIIGFEKAIDYIQKTGYEEIEKHESGLLKYATEKLENIKGLRIIGNSNSKAGVISFTIENYHPHDIGSIMNKFGVALRTGHHCAQPTMERFGVTGTVRISFAFYNTYDEIDMMITKLDKTLKMLA